MDINSKEAADWSDLMRRNSLLEDALKATQWGFNHVRCPVCAGWMMGPYGETDMKHTPDCIVAVALGANG